jgi:hypothetical protein
MPFDDQLAHLVAHDDRPEVAEPLDERLGPRVWTFMYIGCSSPSCRWLGTLKWTAPKVRFGPRSECCESRRRPFICRLGEEELERHVFVALDSQDGRSRLHDPDDEP